MRGSDVRPTRRAHGAHGGVAARDPRCRWDRDRARARGARLARRGVGRTADAPPRRRRGVVLRPAGDGGRRAPPHRSHRACPRGRRAPARRLAGAGRVGVLRRDRAGPPRRPRATAHRHARSHRHGGRRRAAASGGEHRRPGAVRRRRAAPGGHGAADGAHARHRRNDPGGAGRRHPLADARRAGGRRRARDREDRRRAAPGGVPALHAPRAAGSVRRAARRPQRALPALHRGRAAGAR